MASTDSTPLAGRTALVAGASSGIGAALVRTLLAAGAQVHGVARRGDELRAAAPEALTDGRYVAHVLDLTDADAVQELADSLGAETPVDVVCVAAGTNLPNRAFAEVGRRGWDQLVAVNLSAAFYVVDAFLPQLRAARGHVVVIGSVSGAWPDLSGPAYQASKAGLHAMARALAHDEHRNGVRVTTVLPGAVDTPLLDKRPKPTPPEVREQLIQPDDVAAACLAAVTMPARTTVAEITLVPSVLHSIGHTNVPLRLSQES